MKTLSDVKVFIDTLYATDMIWHADDLVSNVSSFDSLSDKPKLQSLMNDAIKVCNNNNCDIFDFYHLED